MAALGVNGRSPDTGWTVAAIRSAASRATNFETNMSKVAMRQALEALQDVQDVVDMNLYHRACERRSMNEVIGDAINALEAALKPRKTGRKPAVNASDVAKVREHIASGGTWKTLRLPVSEGTYYQIRAGRGVYGEVK